MRAGVAEKSMLSGPEQQLYGRLVRAFPGHVILAHVALARLPALDPAACVEHAETSARAHRHMAADFVICRPDFTALAVVEFADGPRNPESRETRRCKDQLLQVAGIKVLRVAAADIPGEHALKALVAALPVRNSANLMRRAS